jgi:hypothetical protein
MKKILSLCLIVGLLSAVSMSAEASKCGKGYYWNGKYCKKA